MKKLLLAFCITGMLFCLSGTSWASVICPGVGDIGPGCNEIITVGMNNSLSVTGGAYPTTPYDGSDDQLIGLINNSGAPLTGIVITGPGVGGFDQDGPWSTTCVTAGTQINPCLTPGTTSDPDDYSGPNNIFSNFASQNSVTVTFVSPLAPGGSTFFALEDAPANPPNITPSFTTAPEPSSMTLAGSALLLMVFGFLCWRGKTHAFL